MHVPQSTRAEGLHGQRVVALVTQMGEEQSREQRLTDPRIRSGNEEDSAHHAGAEHSVTRPEERRGRTEELGRRKADFKAAVRSGSSTGVEQESLDIAISRIAPQHADILPPVLANPGIDQHFESNTPGDERARGLLEGAWRQAGHMHQFAGRSERHVILRSVNPIQTSARGNDRLGQAGVDAGDELKDLGRSGVDIDHAGRKCGKEINQADGRAGLGRRAT